jgi:acyl-CoA synthetase (NDP forming)
MKRLLRFKACQKVLKKYNIPFGKGRVVKSEKELLDTEAKLKYPLVLKILSQQLVHKAEGGGVITHLKDTHQVQKAYSTLRTKAKKKKWALEGILVQEQHQGQEVILGIKQSKQFGQVLAVGVGGVHVEHLKQVRFLFCPITTVEAKNCIQKIPELSFKGEKGKKHVEKLAELLVKLSALALHEHDITELDLNPVILADTPHVVDVRIIRNEKSKEQKQKAKKDVTRKRNLHACFTPKSIAVIGASHNPKKVGHTLVKNLKTGGCFPSLSSRPFPGTIHLINPYAQEILGLPCKPSIKKVGNVDLAIICVNAKRVLKLVKECVGKTKNIIIISAGFGEAKGKVHEEECSKLASKHKLNIIGPNCLGMLNTHANTNASFAPLTPPSGSVALLTQSGALANSVINSMLDKKYGLSKVISIGNQADVTFGDCLDYLEQDKTTQVIAMYIEGIKKGKHFLEAAQKSSKPLIALKGGMTEQGSQALLSHTGNLAGSYDLFKAACAKSGIVLAKSIEEMMDYAKVLSLPLVEGGVAILTNAGGLGVLCSDYCEEQKIALSPLKKSTLKKLKTVHPSHSHQNPLDIIGDALPHQYKEALTALVEQSDVKTVIVIQTVQAMSSPLKTAEAIVSVQKQFPKKTIISCCSDGWLSKESISLLEKQGIPNFPDPLRAVKALKVLMEYGKKKRRT